MIATPFKRSEQFCAAAASAAANGRGRLEGRCEGAQLGRQGCVVNAHQLEDQAVLGERAHQEGLAHAPTALNADQLGLV
jgi:hypothetical protein